MKLRSNVIIQLLMFLLVFSPAWGQYQNISFSHLTTEQGLSQNDVNAIAQDKNGFMWFGTHDGLNKYDGYSFKVFQANPGDSTALSSNLIFALAEDPRGYLWVGTTGGGVNRLDLTTEKFKRILHQEGNPASLSNNHVTTILVAKDSSVWVGTQAGLNHIHCEQGKDAKITKFLDSKDSAATINSLYEDKNGTVWIGTNKGLFMVAGTRNNINIIPIAGMERAIIRAFGETSKGRLLVNANNTLYCREGEQFRSLFQGTFLSIVPDGRGAVWASSSEGVFLYIEKKEYPYLEEANHFTVHVEDPESINKNNVRCLYRGNSGIVWAGTNGGGVNKINLEKKGFRVYRKNIHPGSISYDKVRAIFEDSENTLWVGTEGGGLNVDWDNNQGEKYESFTHYRDQLKSVFSIAETISENDRIIWLGSQELNLSRVVFKSNGEQQIELGFGSKYGVGSGVFALLSDQKGNLWAGSYHQGLFRMIRQSDGTYQVSQFTTENGLSINMVRSLMQDQQGNLWIGTGKGLNKISASELYAEKPSIDVYRNDPKDSTTISYDYILAMHESTDGDLWIGTFGGGLNKLVYQRDGSLKFKSFKEKQGLSNNVIKGILEDNDGYLWISTNKGLNKFDPHSEQFKSYDVTDGLQSNEFSELASLKRHDGEMLFGGVNGFNAFYPSQIKDNPYRPKVAITDFQIFNKSVAIGAEFNKRVILEKAIYESDQIDLKHWENNFSFEFAALHFAAPSKNRYRYKLEGFDQKWTETGSGRRFASYTNIGHGNYVFKVQAANNDGLWNDQDLATIRIVIAPPFWLTWWAYIIYVLMIGLLLYVVRKYTLIGITQKHQLEMEHLTREKTEEIHQMKLRFFTNISHEFRTPLTLILGPLEQLLKSGNEYGLPDRKRMYVLMQKNARLLLKLINQLMDFRKIDQGKMKLYLTEENIPSFVHELAEPFQLIATSKEIDFKITSERAIHGLLDKDKVEKILYNLLSNAFKFTPKGGSIFMSVKEEKEVQGDWVRIEVKDTGVGIPDDRVGKVFERFFQANEKSAAFIGTGIGLSYTKSLVEMHQGEISFTSKEGRGTTFVVKLPLSKKAYSDAEHILMDSETGFDLLPERWVDVDLEKDFMEESSHSDHEKGRKMPLKVLIVDDNAEIREFIKSAFYKHFNVVEAINGEQGLAITEKENPDLIITDVMMPVMDGVEFCEKLKSNIKTSHIPVLMLTAKNTHESELEGLQHGADFYLTKPFEIEKLLLSVNNLLKGREALRKRFTNEVLLQPSEITVNSTDNSFLSQAMEVVEDNMDNPDFTVEEFVREMGMSRSKLHLKMKSLTDQSASEFIRTVRLKRAVQLMEQSDISVKEIMYQTGFNTASYFSKCFKKQFGMSPTDYLNKEPLNGNHKMQ
ncbi:two-component regulator propeller domain-containing protein [Echinicola sediminis]